MCSPAGEASYCCEGLVYVRTRHRGFTHRRMAPDGGLSLCGQLSSWVTCTVQRQQSHAWYSGLAGLHMNLGVSFKVSCLRCTVSIWNWRGGGDSVVEVRFVMNQQDLEVSKRCLPELEARMFSLFLKKTPHFELRSGGHSLGTWVYFSSAWVKSLLRPEMPYLHMKTSHGSVTLSLMPDSQVSNAVPSPSVHSPLSPMFLKDHSRAWESRLTPQLEFP